MARTSNLGFYRLTYKNNISQVKELISREDFEYYTTLNKEKGSLELKVKGKKVDKNQLAIDKARLAEVNSELLANFQHEFFVEGSPLHKAMETGIMVIEPPAGNAGTYLVQIVKTDLLADSLDIELEDTCQ